MKANLAITSFLAATAYAVWPLPSKYSEGNGVLFIERGKVRVNYKGPGSSSPKFKRKGHGSSMPDVISKAIDRTYGTIFEANFVPWKLRPRLSKYEPAVGSGGRIRTINLEQSGNDASNATDIDESYSLEVTESGDVTVKAQSSVGLLYGLTTFTQLFYKHSKGGVYTDKAPVSVTDAPKFKWRGLNLDTSRTFKPLADIFRTIDALAYNKMNRLHWHITDAQSWPLEVPSMPDLANKGVYVNFQRYTPDDVQAVYEYGAYRGIEVDMEIDMPGHTSSIWFSRPDLITAFNTQPDWTTYCAEPPCGSLKLNSPQVYDFLQGLFDDVLPRIKPRTSYFHLGGDEVNRNAYLLDETVQSNDSAVLQPLMQRFMDRNMNQIKSYGLTPLVWEEMLLEWNLTLPQDTIVQTWQSDEAVAKTTAKGYQALAGNYNYWYLDCGHGQWLDFSPVNAAGFWPFNDYCAPLHNWRLMYSYDPLTGVPENATHLVIGGEVHIWSEQTDEINLDDRVWPRSCAAAEVLWSGAKDAQGHNRSQIEASPRLAEMRERLVAMGVNAGPIQMPFCTQNGTQCAYPTA